MEQAITDEMERLATMPVQQLRARYREVYGEDSSTGHKQHLVRRIAWRLQVLAQRHLRGLALLADVATDVLDGLPERLVDALDPGHVRGLLGCD